MASSEWRVGGTNPGVRDAHIDDLIQQGKQPIDQAKRQQIYNELQRLVTQNPPYIYIADIKVAWGTGNDVTGINWITNDGQFLIVQDGLKKGDRVLINGSNLKDSTLIIAHPVNADSLYHVIR